MKAVLRVWWTFFTAFPIQRWLAIAGAVVCAFFVASGLAAGQTFWKLGPLALFIFIVFPAFMSSAGVFRALSAPRMHQLLPRFRLRMLGALGLLLVSVFASFVLFAWGPGWIESVPVSAFAFADLALYAAVFLIWPFIYLTAAFVLFFLASGDGRWMLAIPAAAIALGAVGEAGRAALLSASTVLLWLAAAVIAWPVFAIWYSRARTIGPVTFAPQPLMNRWSRIDVDQTPGRELAVHALVATRLPRPFTPILGVVGLALGLVIILGALTPAMRTFPFTSFVWPFACMGLLGGTTTRTVHRSRLLWLRIPGAREAVRREVERSLWKNWATSLVLLSLIAVAYASPLGDATPTEVLLGLALTAAAGLYGAYVMFASVPSVATQLIGFGSMGAAYLALLSRVDPSPTVVIAITAAEIVGAVSLRALAVRRWESIDWLRVRPITGVAGILQ